MPAPSADNAPEYALITRPREAGRDFAQHLAARGKRAILAPVIEIAPLPPPPTLTTDLERAQAILFTSANGVQALAAASPVRDQPVFTVGNTTAHAARQAGFTHVESAQGDTESLARLVTRRLAWQDGALFHAVDTVGGGPLQQRLAKSGFTVHRCPLYRAYTVPRLPERARQALATGRVDTAFFFSARTAHTFVRLVRADGLADTCAAVSAYALSPGVATPLRDLTWRTIATARHPQTEALLDLLGDP